MSQGNETWSVASLKNALDGLDADVGIQAAMVPGTDILEVTLASAGDFALHVSVGDVQILTSAVLWPRDAQDDPETFEAMMLRSHKSLLPLCALSIDTIEGREYYELFGAMSNSATMGEILTEFSSIADSALELARDIGPRATTSEGAA